MKAEYRIIVISILAGALLWVIEGLLDYVFQGTTFWGGLILNIPLYEILLRSAIVTCFVVYGLVLSRTFTKRKQAEEALRRSEERYRLLVENANEGIVVVQEGIVAFTNPKAVEIMGCSREELIGRPFAEFVHPEDREIVAERYAKRMRGEEVPPKYAIRVINAAGDTVWVAVNVAPITWEGKPATLNFVTDITQRVRAEEALRRSEERYRAVAEGAFAGIGIVDPDENITYANRAFAEMLGYTPDELIGMNLSQLTSPEEYARYREFTQRRKEEGGREHYETMMYRKDGTAINLLVSASPLTTADGRFAGTMGVIVDITERVRMEKTQSVLLSISEAASTTDNLTELLRIIHKQLGTLLNATNFYVALYDEETGLYSFPYHVDQYDRVDNHTPQELGRGLTEYVRRTGAPLLADEELIEELVRKGEIERVGTPSRVWMGAPLRTPRGVIGVAAVQSYTDQDAYSSDDLDLLAFVSEHIASVIDHKRAEREREEAQSRFLQAQKMEAIGRLTGGIAHDFNNLLTAINGFAQLLQIDLPSSDPRQEYVARIREAGQRAAQLTRQLLAFSRKQIIAPRVVNLNEVVRDVDKMLRRIIGEDIEIDMVLSPDLWLVKVDPSQMQQVIINLAVNARDAMSQGGKLTIETANVLLDEEYVRSHPGAKVGEHIMLAISDTGVGMSEEVQAHIFEPFFTTKEEGKGTGLGLATVYGIVKQSGGNIWYYSEEGMGTTFKIYLPRTLEEEATVEKGEETTAIPKGQGVIFLVEDDDTVRELSVWILRRAGYTVLDTSNPEEAIERVRDYPGRVDLLITDVVMPGMSGRELAQRIAEIRPGVKVLYMSGYTDNAIVDHSVLEPGMAFLQKPFTPNTLAGKVREVLGG